MSRLGILPLLLSLGVFSSMAYRPVKINEGDISANLRREIEETGLPCRRISLDERGTYHLDFTGSGITNIHAISEKVFPAICREFTLRSQLHAEAATSGEGRPREFLRIEKDRIGIPNIWLYFIATPIQDISPLKGLPVVGLDLRDTKVTDLAPIEGMRLTELNINSTKVQDISPLRGMPLEWLDLGNTPVKDISPLVGMKLQFVNFLNTSVSDVSVLSGMTIELAAKGGVAYRFPGQRTSAKE